MRGVYLLHLIPPYRHARHYMGWSADVARRLARHANGQGARLLAVALAAGCTWRLVRLWPNASRADERKLKNMMGVRCCPLCRGRSPCPNVRRFCRKTRKES